MTPQAECFACGLDLPYKSLGSAAIAVYNPKIKQMYRIKFQVVADKLAPVLGNAAVQEMALVTMHSDRYQMVAAVQPVKSKSDYIKRYSAVFKQPVGKLEGEVNFHIDDSMKPTALPARQIPVALSEPVKRHLPGREMHLADALSRAYPKGNTHGMTFDTINTVSIGDLTSGELKALHQAIWNDQQMRELYCSIQKGWPQAKRDCPPALTPVLGFQR